MDWWVLFENSTKTDSQHELRSLIIPSDPENRPYEIMSIMVMMKMRIRDELHKT